MILSKIARANAVALVRGTGLAVLLAMETRAQHAPSDLKLEKVFPSGDLIEGDHGNRQVIIRLSWPDTCLARSGRDASEPSPGRQRFQSEFRISTCPGLSALACSPQQWNRGRPDWK